MTTPRGTPCPTCKGDKKGKTTTVAMLPLKRADGATVDPHRYSVCDKCYDKQRKQFYAK